MSKASPRPAKSAPKKKTAKPAASPTEKKRAPRPKRAALMKKRRRRARILAASGMTMIIAATGLMGYAWWIDSSQPGPLEPLTESLDSIPHLLQWDQRWGYVPYGTGDGKQLCMYYTGCAPTCMSMIASYLKQDPALTPVVMSELSIMNDDYENDQGTKNTFFGNVCNTYNLGYEELGQDESALRAALEQGNPVIINVGEGDFTKKDHFIVAAGMENDQIRILDPGAYSTSHLWSFEDILRQTKTMWSFWNPNGNPQNEANDFSAPASPQNEDSSDYGSPVDEPVPFDPDQPSVQGA